MIEDTEDLKTVYNWFTHPNENRETHISPYGSQTVEEIRTALSTHSLAEARQISHNLYFSETNNKLEVGEILVRAAIYALYLGEDEHLKFAKEQIQNAVETYPDEEFHYRAISLWLLGFIYWQTPNFRQQAIQQWGFCLRVLDHLSYSPASPNPGWYQKIRFQVLESLFQTRMLKRYFSLKDVKYYQIETRKRLKLPAAIATTRTTKSPRKSRIIQSLPVYQYVPAGGWGVVDPNEVGQVEIENFIIDGIPHFARDLIGRGRVTIQQGVDYALVRIKGTSMNLLDIQHGDYVLIRRQEEASQRDIVLAERIGIDSEATLKRFYRQSNKIELRPESDDPKNPILPVDDKDSLRILGVAIGVLKPVGLQTESQSQSNEFVPLKETFPMEIVYIGEPLDLESLGIIHLNLQAIIDKVVHTLLSRSGQYLSIQRLLTESTKQKPSIAHRIVKANIEQIQFGSFLEQISFSIAAILISNPHVIPILQNLGSDIIWAISESGMRGFRNKILPPINSLLSGHRGDPANIGDNLREIAEVIASTNNHKKVEIRFRSKRSADKEDVEFVMIID